MGGHHFPCMTDRRFGQHTVGPLPMDHIDPRAMRADYDAWPQDEFHNDGVTKVQQMGAWPADEMWWLQIPGTAEPQPPHIGLPHQRDPHHPCQGQGPAAPPHAGGAVRQRTPGIPGSDQALLEWCGEGEQCLPHGAERHLATAGVQCAPAHPGGGLAGPLDLGVRHFVASPGGSVVRRGLRHLPGPLPPGAGCADELPLRPPNQEGPPQDREPALA